ncbi:MAG: hypothetical protein ACOC1K_08360 [Nanoarchaeota archaeon]
MKDKIKEIVENQIEINDYEYEFKCPYPMCNFYLAKSDGYMLEIHVIHHLIHEHILKGKCECEKNEINS